MSLVYCVSSVICVEDTIVDNLQLIHGIEPVLSFSLNLFTTISGSKQSYQKHLMQKDTRQVIRWQEVDVPLITSWRRRLNWSLMKVPQSLFQSCSVPVARRSSPRGQQTSIWLAMCGLRAWQDPLFIITWHSERVQCGNNFIIPLLCQYCRLCISVRMCGW